MMNSEVGIAPVAAVCHRRRTDPKNPTDCWSVATFGRKPQIEPVTPTFHSPRQSSPIVPNRAIFLMPRYRATNPTETPTEYWSGGVMGKWSNLATYHPVRRGGCRILEQKQTKETMREFRFRIGTSLSLFASVQNPGQSCLIVPNRATSCLDALQSQPPSCSKIATSPILLRQTRSKPVKPFCKLGRWTALPAGTTIYRAFPGTIHSQWWLDPCADTLRGKQSAIRNPKSAIPSDSTWFHLIPLNSTSSTPGRRVHEHAENRKTPPVCPNRAPGITCFAAPSPALPIKANKGE
jgi:hypothetical protein